MAQYGPELYWRANGDIATFTPVRVFPRNSNTLASLYSDANLTIPLPNPCFTDGSGMLTFYAASGDYWLHVAGLTFPITITTDGTWSATFRFVQVTPIDPWLITHNLDAYPSVLVVDGNGDEVFAQVMYQDANTVVIEFGDNTAGTAYLRR
jgi:hypothetical protein